MWAQDSTSIKNAWQIEAQIEIGRILKTNYFLQDNIEGKLPYTGYSLQWIKNSTGAKDWEKLYNYPSYGIGVFAYDYHTDIDFGSPFGVYGVFVPVAREFGKWRWQHQFQFGISFNSRPFSVEDNYLNPSIGSKTNMFISLGTGLYYELGNNFDLGVNLKLNHMSNGALKTPNKGFNIGAAQLSVVYHPERAKRKALDSLGSPIKDERFNTVELSAFAGRKNVFYKDINRSHLKLYEGLDYSVGGVEAFYMKQYSRKSAYGMGVGVTYDEHYNHAMYVQDSTLMDKRRFSNNEVLLSIIPSYRLMIDKLYVNIGAGYYVNKKSREYDKSKFFQRIGLHYQFTDRLFASFAINAYDFHVANYLEWKIGYTLFRKKTN